MKYCKVKTADDYPVSVPQVRQLRRNIDWVRANRLNAIGVYGRLATDGFAVVDGDMIMLPQVEIDLSFWDTVYWGIVVDGSGTAVWEVSLSMTGGATADISTTFTNPGALASYVGSCTPGHSQPRVCLPQVRFTRVSGSGKLKVKYIGLWGYHATDIDHGPANIQPAYAADLQSALSAAEQIQTLSPALIGWFGNYHFPTSSITPLRWYALGDKNDDDEALQRPLMACCLVYQSTANSGKFLTLIHSQNDAASTPTTAYLPDSATGIYTPVDLFHAATSYDTASPYSGGKLDVSADADPTRPFLRGFCLQHRLPTAMLTALSPAYLPAEGMQIRTTEAAGAVGINEIAEYVHQLSWYQGGNCAGGLHCGTGKSFTISTSYVTVFDGLVWVHDDAQSGSTWGSNTYQVAIRATNGSTAVDMTCQLTVDGQTGTDTATFANGENYLVFDVSLASIDITDYAVACKIELQNSASRTTTIHSVQISRHGGAY